MSSLGAAAEQRSAPAPARILGQAARVAELARLGRVDPLWAALTAALVAIAFVTTGGGTLGPNTWTEIALVVAGALACAAAVVLTPRRPAHGVVALAAFAALAALTLASVGWSVDPAASWLEGNRTLAYLGVFTCGIVLARVAGARASSVALAVLSATTVICAYALLAKVFPGSLDPQEFLGRLRAPFSYWNAVGLTAALGLPGAVWFGAQRERGGALRGLAVPAGAILLTALILCYSRGALLVTAIGLGLWFALVPLRLRGVAILALAALAAAPGVAWALSTKAITSDNTPLVARTAAGHSFGLVLAVLLALAGAGGVLAVMMMDTRPLAPALRRRIGTGLVVLVGCLPLVGIGALAASSRGLTGQVSHLWHQLTDPNSRGLGDNAGRLASVSNSRAGYWSDALKVGEHNLVSGAGAVGFAIARTRYSTNVQAAGHAHGYLFETFADFGLLGLAVTAALLAAWALAARRTLRRTGAGAGRDPAALGAERAALLTLLAVVVTFGAHSAIDWTWFVPGVAVPSLLCAGWLAGRGPAGEAPPPGPVARAQMLGRRPAAAALGLALAAALTIGWTIWQPLRAAQAQASALTQLSESHLRAAYDDELTAISRNPLAVEPLWDLATIYAAAGQPAQAHQALVRAVRLQPSNPATWLQLGEFDLGQSRGREALAVLQAAQYLGPLQPETLSALTEAKAMVAQGR